LQSDFTNEMGKTVEPNGADTKPDAKPNAAPSLLKNPPSLMARLNPECK